MMTLPAPVGPRPLSEDEATDARANGVNPDELCAFEVPLVVFADKGVVQADGTVILPANIVLAPPSNGMKGKILQVQANGTVQMPVFMPSATITVLRRRRPEELLQERKPDEGVLSYLRSNGLLKIPPHVMNALGLHRGGGVVFQDNEDGTVTMMSNDTWAASQVDDSDSVS